MSVFPKKSGVGKVFPLREKTVEYPFKSMAEHVLYDIITKVYLMAKLTKLPHVIFNWTVTLAEAEEKNCWVHVWSSILY